MTPVSQTCLRARSCSPFLVLEWNHCDMSELQSESGGGPRTSTPATHRRHRSLSWVSLTVSASSLKRSRRSESEKWRSTSSSWSTTHELSAFLCACRWKIFSSMVPTASIL